MFWFKKSSVKDLDRVELSTDLEGEILDNSQGSTPVDGDKQEASAAISSNSESEDDGALLDAVEIEEEVIIDPYAVSVELEVEIAKASHVAMEVVAGNLEARIIEIDEESPLADLLHSLNDMIDRTDAYVRESAACMEHVENNK